MRRTGPSAETRRKLVELESTGAQRIWRITRKGMAQVQGRIDVI